MLGSLCLLSEGMLHFMEKEKSDLFQLFQDIKAVPKRMEDIEWNVMEKDCPLMMISVACLKNDCEEPVKIKIM